LCDASRPQPRVLPWTAPLPGSSLQCLCAGTRTRARGLSWSRPALGRRSCQWCRHGERHRPGRGPALSHSSNIRIRTRPNNSITG
jgi:hypothetical protein